jgi:RimJ/RimL family protein N-acetyltransferase
MFRWETERLVLRPFEEGDMPYFVAYRSDPEVARYQGWEAPYSDLNAQVFLRFMENIRPGIPGEWYQFAVELKEAGHLIGDIGLQVVKQDPQQAEFGITFAREFQGRGYATEAMRRVFAYGFDDLKLHRIFSRLDARNTASGRLMERLGMRLEAHFIQNAWFKGEWTDECWYGMLREEWYAP